MNRCCLMMILLVPVCFGEWPAPKSAREAYDFVQRRRTEARKLFERGDPQGIEEGIRISRESLLYLDQPSIQDLATGDRYLEARRSNVFIDLAEAYALQGATQECLRYLRQVLILFPDPKIAKYLEGDRLFNALHANPEFNDIVNRFRQFEQFWDSKALSTPFRENISDAEKLAGLGKLWSEVKYNFGFPDKLLEVDWDKLYMEWIPRILATKSTGAYYRELQLLCARLNDGHTAIIPPRQLDIWAKPPLLTRLVEGHVMILEVLSPSLRAQGVLPGMEITAVEGEPVVAYARREIEPYESASTSQGGEVRTFSHAFLRGPAERPVRLKLRDASGHEFDKEVARSGFQDVRSRPGFEWRLLAGNIGYVALNRFDQQEVATRFGEAFREIAKSSALILDLRQNGGGNSGVGFAILPYLLDQPAPIQRQVMRSQTPPAERVA